MRGVNKIIIILIICLSFISCKSKREDIISFVEYDYSQIADEKGMPSDNVIQKYLVILTEKYGEPDYGDFCKHRWNNFDYEEYYITLPYWKTKNSKVFLYRGDENNDSDYHFCFIGVDARNNF